MNNLILAAPIFIVIVTNGLLCESRSVYRVNPYDIVLTKRSNNEVDRRSFLQSFCASRCNIGKGGNVCRCNGFHFAGKRTSNALPRQQENLTGSNVGDSEEVVFKVLEDHNKILVDPNSYRHKYEALPENELLKEILDVMPEIFNEQLDNRTPDPRLGPVLEEFFRSDEI